MLNLILSSIAATVVAAILFAAASHKLRAPHRFSRQLEDYDLLPGAVVGSFARVLPWVELSAAFVLLVPGLRALGAVLAALLLVSYSGAIAVNLWRGRLDIDCGCSGPGLERPLNAALLIRNTVLLGLVGLAALPVGDLSMQLPQLLLVTICVLVSLILYTAVEGLLTNAPRLKSVTGE